MLLPSLPLAVHPSIFSFGIPLSLPLPSLHQYLQYTLQLSAMLVVISSLLTSAFAAPITNSTALHHDIAPGWVAGPKTRGTWQILYSCVFTLVLCVYTAIHLNVPAKSDTALRFWLRKLKWVVVAIFAPEIVVYAAFEQWYLARKFLKELKEIASDSDDEKFKVSTALEYFFWGIMLTREMI